VISRGDPVEPAAEADQRAGGPVDVADPVQQPPPAAQRPRVGQMGDRLLHQRAQPRLQAVERPLGVGETVLGAAVPNRGMPVLARLCQPAEPRSSRLATSTSSSTPPSPASSDPGPARKCSTTPSVTPPPPRARRWPPSTATCCGATVAGPGAATSTNCSRSRRSGGAGRTEVVTLVDRWLRGWPRPGLPPATYLNRHHGHPHWTPPRSAGRPCRTSRAGWRAGSVASPAGRPDRTRGRGR
jgi:hypothetical protein